VWFLTLHKGTPLACDAGVEHPLYGAQTKLAIQNFSISGMRFPREFLRALGMIKAAAAAVNRDLGLLDSPKAASIEQAAAEVESGIHDSHFPVDIYQTGSGTSTNMNANEVIAALASQRLGAAVHPNDDVNMGQSSNDVIPAAMHISASLALKESLLPSLSRLAGVIEAKASAVEGVVKNGRTHLMDALPVRLSQELRGWKCQITDCFERVQSALPRLSRLALGGTAVGTGVNAHPEFGRRVAALLASKTGLPFVAAPDYFAALSSQDTAVELSGHLKTAAVALMKISNDLRWMNSGPISGLSEIRLPELQAGSSIMPGKVNPVIPEAVTMVCARVFGNDLSITVAGQSGNFQLNVMLPLLAHCLLENIRLLSRASESLAEKAIQGFEVNKNRLDALARRNPMLATVLTPLIGYEKSAQIVKKALAEERSIEQVALEMTDLDAAELKRLLDPIRATEPGRSTRDS
jgi:fumarate hydratase, class II